MVSAWGREKKGNAGRWLKVSRARDGWASTWLPEIQ